MKDTLTVTSLNEISYESAVNAKGDDPKHPGQPYRGGPAWPIVFFIWGMHLFALFGFFTFSWSALALCIALHWLTGGLGITLGFHRLLTHRSFRTPKPLEYLFAILGSMACQGGPIKWVAAHRLHHAYSDQRNDPHSPRHGFFWSHMGWCLTKNKVLDNSKYYSKYAPDLAKDSVHVFLDNFHLLWTILLAIGLYFWGGWSFVIWGVCVRIVILYHCTWFVNSATHKWGYQTYKSNDDSRNLWWVALLTYGEGWHNNHHAFQTSARHGLKLWEIDTTYWMVCVLKFLKLADNIKLPQERLLKANLA